jgi:hypothetical protein
MSKGTAGAFAALGALVALGGAAVVGTISLVTASSYVGDTNTNGHCIKTYLYCDQDGIDAKNRAHTEALIADGLLLLGTAALITFYVLPNQDASQPATTVGVAPQQHGFAAGLIRSFW